MLANNWRPGVTEQQSVTYGSSNLGNVTKIWATASTENVQPGHFCFDYRVLLTQLYWITIIDYTDGIVWYPLKNTKINRRCNTCSISESPLWVGSHRWWKHSERLLWRVYCWWLAQNPKFKNFPWITGGFLQRRRPKPRVQWQSSANRKTSY